MQEWIIGIMDQFGYIGVASLIAIENVFPPIPSEVILTFGGFMTTFTSMNVWLVILWATVGAVVGALVLYGVGRLFSAEKIEKILSGKIGKVLHLKPEDVEKAKMWFEKRGKYTVFFCRFIPIVRSLISIPAGMAQMGMPSFLILTIIGTTIWNTVLVWLGVAAGASWEKIAGYFDTYSSVALVVLAVFGIALIGIFYYKRLHETNKNKNEE